MHYAISSLFEDYPERVGVYCYDVKKEDHKEVKAGKIKLAIGRVQVSSQITRESERVTFSVLHLGNHDFNGGVRQFLGDEAYQMMVEEIVTAFEKGAFAEVVRLMDKHFGMHSYSLKDLFKDEQRKILNLLLRETMKEFESDYRQLYEDNRILMGFLYEAGIPIPRPFLVAAEFTLNLDAKRALEGEIDVEKIQNIPRDIQKWNILVDTVGIEFILRHRTEQEMDKFFENPSDLSTLEKMEKILDMAFSLPIELNLWEVQNIYHKMASTIYGDYHSKAMQGDEQASLWTEKFKSLGQKLSFNVGAILP